MPDARKSFYVIDGHAHIYRAYFAPFRDLTSPSGEPTKATFVFTQMLLNLIERRKPDYLCMVIDEGGDEGVFRKAIYPEYKSTRKERPNDFTPQEQRILRLVRDAGVPIFGKPGFEADDLIATIADRLCDRGFDIYMVSKDKDLRQVVSDCTRMYDVQSDKVLDAAEIEREYGYAPREAVEVQTLMGDKIDNVPGIPGVGETTAAKLVRKYGSADAILGHLDELTPKLRENFERHGHQFALTRQLVTLKRDVEFDFSAEACAFRGLSTAGLRAHLEELGFHALLKRLPGNGAPDKAPGPAPTKGAGAFFPGSLFGDDPADATTGGAAPASTVETSAGCDYVLVNTPDALAAFVAALREQTRFAFDTETDALGAMNSRMIGMSFSWAAGTGHYVPVRGPAGCVLLDERVVLDAVRPVLEDPAVAKVGHNIKYDLMVARNAGIDLRGIAMDTMVAAFVLDASRNSYGIDTLARDLLNFQKIPTTDLIGKGKAQRTMDCVELERVARYAAEDADVTWRLAELLGPRLDAIPEIKRLNDDLETPLIQVLAEMETNGIAIDPAILREQSVALGEKVGVLREQVFAEAKGEFNVDSPRQLEKVLFVDMGLKAGKKTKTGFSTDVQELERLAATGAKIAQLILDYRSLVKLKNTYLDNLTEYVNPRTGRIHTHFNQAGAATGRLSSSDPNLQNIPIRTDEGRRIRLAFVPGDPARNVLLTADYGQIELRVLAHYTGEPALVRAFAADEDVHRTVAAEVFNTPPDAVTREQRNYAKTINFGIIYGVSAFGLAARIDGLDVKSAGELIRAYHVKFPGIQGFFDKCVRDAQDHGYVETILGRRRPIPDITSGVIAQRNYAQRAAINSVVQGSAADLIKTAMLRVHARLLRERRPSKMLLQVHDELVFETPADAAATEAEMVREEMQTAMTLRVPLKVEVGWGKNWQEVK